MNLLEKEKPKQVAIYKGNKPYFLEPSLKEHLSQLVEKIYLNPSIASPKHPKITTEWLKNQFRLLVMALRGFMSSGIQPPESAFPSSLQPWGLDSTVPPPPD